MKNPIFRRFSTSLDHFRKNPNLNPPQNPTFLPIPHRSIPHPVGQDLDFVTVAYSHLINSEWPRLDSMIPGLNPFRIKHILLRIKKDPVLSLEFFDWVRRQKSSSIDLETQTLILHISTKAKRFDFAETLLREAVIPRARKAGEDIFDLLLYSYRLCDSSPRIFDCVFKVYARMRKFRSATEMFCRMRDFGFFPKVKSCNVYMSSLLKFGRTDVIALFYREMRRCRITPNVYTLNMVMSSLINSGKLEKAMSLFEEMEGMGIGPVISTFNTVIAGNCKNGLLGFAVKLKNAMRDRGLQPNVITYNTLISGFCKERKIHDANKMFNEMKAANIQPNTITYATLINGYCLMGNNDMASMVHEEMLKDNVKADILTYNALIRGLCDEGKTRKATHLVKELDKLNISPNFWTFFALMNGQCKRQNSERAFQIYEVMKKCRFLPNNETYKMLISIFCKNKDFEGALEIVKEMLDAWMVPDHGLLVELFGCLSRSGKSQLAADLISAYSGREFLHQCLVDSQISASPSINKRMCSGES